MTTTEPEIVDMQRVAIQWTKIKGRLQAEVGDVEYRTWLRQMSLAGLDGDEITVNLPTRFLRDWVSTRYGDRIRALWQAESSEVRRVDIRVGGEVGQPAPPAQDVLPPVGTTKETTPTPRAEPARATVPAAATANGWQEERV